jgi:tetratricopeptide (TPR) repeat protein
VAVAAALLALGALGGCTPLSAEQAKCRAVAADEGQLKEKIAACTAAIGRDLKDEALADALVRRGDARRSLGDAAGAIADYGAALQASPRDSGAFNARGFAYLKQGDNARALADFNRAIDANPEDHLALANRGYIEQDQGRYDDAIRDESRAIELNPDAAAAWVNRGFAYLGKHQWDMAIADFADGLRISREDVNALHGRALAEFAKGDHVAALKDFNGVVGADPAGDYALGDANQAVTLAPQDAIVLNSRCWVRGVRNTQLDGALADCQASLQLKPDVAETLDSLGLVYFRLGRYDDAVKTYTQALAIDDTLPSSHYVRGVAELRLGDQVAAQADLQRAAAEDKGMAARFAGWGVKP